MQMLLLLYGALLGVVNSFSYHDEMHLSMREGDESFTWWANDTINNNPSYNLFTSFFRITPAATTHIGDATQCDSSLFAGGTLSDWWVVRMVDMNALSYSILKVNDVNTSVTPPTAIRTTDFVTGGSIVGAGVAGNPILSNFNKIPVGKYRVCGCFSATSSCPTQITSSPVSSPYNYNFGYLHVVDSAPTLFKKSNVLQLNGATTPLIGAPRIFLSPDGTVKASWMFNQLGQDSLDAFQVRTFDPLPHHIGEVNVKAFDGSYLGAFSCGLPLGSGEAFLTSPVSFTAVTKCTNQVNSGSPTYQSKNCSDEYVVEMKNAITSQAANSEAYLCFCDYDKEGMCNAAEKFGAALGPIFYRSFVSVTDSTKHYTVRTASAQTITIGRDGTTDQPSALGLVRVSNGISTGGDFNYTHAKARRCGWSNLDPFPSSPKTNGQAVFAQEFNSTITLDFNLAHASRYHMCACFSTLETLPEAWQTYYGVGGLSTFPKVGASACPNPAMSGFLNVAHSHNGEGANFQTYYYSSVGVLHVVNTMSADIGILLQRNTWSYFNVLFASRKEEYATATHYGRAADYHTYNSDEFKQNRFYVTAGTCGVDGIAPGDTWKVLESVTTMYTRTTDAGATSVFHPEYDPSFSPRNYVNPKNPGLTISMPASAPLPWSVVHSLTTGWGPDSLKSGKGAGTSGSDATASGLLINSAGLQIYGRTEDGQTEASYSLCYCDAALEGISTCANPTNYDSFSTRVGTVKIAKFTFQSLANLASPAHYTVSRYLNQSFSLPIPGFSQSTTGTANAAKDKWGLIPAYGDGQGVDILNPVGRVSGNSNAVPVKTDYFCGKAALGTQHLFHVDTIPLGGFPQFVYSRGHTTDAYGANAYSFDASTSSPTELTTSLIDFSKVAPYKYKICVCSYAAWGNTDCPINNIDFGAEFDGWVNAYRFSDFAGYLHIIDIDYYHNKFTTALADLPDDIYDAFHSQSFPTANGYNQVLNGGEDIFYIDNAVNSASTCGSSLSFQPIQAGNITNVSASLLTWHHVNSTGVNSYKTCMCWPVHEMFHEVTTNGAFTPPTCNINQNSANYGFQLSTHRRIAPPTLDYFVADSAVRSPYSTQEVVARHSGQHFTVTSQPGNQTFSIVKNVEALISTKATSSHDTVAFKPIVSTVGSPYVGCSGLSAVTVPIASDDGTSLTIEPFNFNANGYVNKQNLALVCYCMHSLITDTDTVCDINDPFQWIHIGYLHVLDVSVWPQDFVLPVGIDKAAGTGTLAPSVTISATNGYDGSQQKEFSFMNPHVAMKFASTAGKIGSSSSLYISGGNQNGDGNKTFRCGATSERPLLPLSEYKSNFEDFVTLILDTTSSNSTPAWDPSSVTELAVEVEVGNLVGNDPATSSTAGEILGADNYKWLCVCDSLEPSTTLDPLGNYASHTCTSDPTSGFTLHPRLLSRFGITFGRVWAAKSLVFPGYVYNGNISLGYRSVFLYDHWTVSDSATESFTLQGTLSASATTFTADDYAGVLDHSGFSGDVVSDSRRAFLETTTPFFLNVGQGRGTPCGSRSFITTKQVVLGTGGAASVTLDATSLGASSTYSSKHIVCLCRAAVTGSCSADAHFFNMAGYLHVVRATIATVYKSSTGITINDMKVMFNGVVYPNSLDRFAVIRLDETGASKCGKFVWNHEKLFSPAKPNYHLFELLAAPPVSEDDYDSLNMYDKVSSRAPIIEATISGVSIRTPDVRFLSNGKFSLCYCAYTAEGICSSSTTDDVTAFEYYASYGAEVARMEVKNFLTQTSSQTFTIFKQDLATIGNPNLDIVKTSTSTLAFDVVADKWAVASLTATCGDVSSTPVKDKSLSGFNERVPLPPVHAYDAAPAYSVGQGHSILKQVGFPQRDYPRTTSECHKKYFRSTDNTTYDCDNMVAKTAFSGYFVDVAVDKYQLCLCSAVGTSMTQTYCDVTPTTGLRDYSDLAGHVYVVDAKYQYVTVPSAVPTSVSVSFGTEQTLSSNDRLGYVNRFDMCGESSVSPLIATYSVVSGGNTQTLSTSDVLLSAGVWTLCYCSHTLEGSCDTSADYGIMLGTLTVSDLSISLVRSVDNVFIPYWKNVIVGLEDESLVIDDVHTNYLAMFWESGNNSYPVGLDRRFDDLPTGQKNLTARGFHLGVQFYKNTEACPKNLFPNGKNISYSNDTEFLETPDVHSQFSYLVTNYSLPFINISNQKTLTNLTNIILDRNTIGPDGMLFGNKDRDDFRGPETALSIEEYFRPCYYEAEVKYGTSPSLSSADEVWGGQGGHWQCSVPSLTLSGDCPGGNLSVDNNFVYTLVSDASFPRIRKIDLTVTPTLVDKNERNNFMITYTNTLTYNSKGQYLYYLKSNLSCSDATLPLTTTSTSQSSGVHEVVPSGSSIAFDFSNAGSDEYSMCVGSGCTFANGQGSCISYAKLTQDGTTTIKVFDVLSISKFIFNPNAPTTAQPQLNISKNGVMNLDNTTLYFSNTSCTNVSASPPASAHMNLSFATASASSFLFTGNLSSYTPSQIPHKLCGVEYATYPFVSASILTYPVSIIFVDVVVSPASSTRSVSQISFDGVSNFANSISKLDFIFFADVDVSCTAPGPQASATTTQTILFESKLETYAFDFSKVPDGKVMRLCVIPNDDTSGTVYDYDHELTRILVLDVSISPSSILYVPQAAYNNGANRLKYNLTLSLSTWFQPSSVYSLQRNETCIYSTSQVAADHFIYIPPPTTSLTYTTEVTVVLTEDANQTTTPYVLCHCLLTDCTRVPSATLYTLFLKLETTAVKKSAQQEISIGEIYHEIEDGDLARFVHTSLPCGFAGDAKTSFTTDFHEMNITTDVSNGTYTHSKLGIGMQHRSFYLDFSDVSLSKDAYRLCLYKPANQVLDVTYAKLHVTDLSIVRLQDTNSTTQLTVQFRTEDGYRQPYDTELIKGDIVYLSSSAGRCVNETETTPSLVIRTLSEPYTFTMQAKNEDPATSQFADHFGLRILCRSRVLASGETELAILSTVTLYHYLVKAIGYPPVPTADLLDTDKPIRVPSLNVHPSLNLTNFDIAIAHNGDLLNKSVFWLAGTENNCADYSDLSKSGPGALYSMATILNASVALFNFNISKNMQASPVPYRLCAEIDSDLVVDMSAVQLMVRSYTFVRDYLYNYESNARDVITISFQNNSFSIGEFVTFYSPTQVVYRSRDKSSVTKLNSSHFVSPGMLAVPFIVDNPSLYLDPNYDDVLRIMIAPVWQQILDYTIGDKGLVLRSGAAQYSDLQFVVSNNLTNTERRTHLFFYSAPRILRQVDFDGSISSNPYTSNRQLALMGRSSALYNKTEDSIFRTPTSTEPYYLSGEDTFYFSRSGCSDFDASVIASSASSGEIIGVSDVSTVNEDEAELYVVFSTVRASSLSLSKDMYELCHKNNDTNTTIGSNIGVFVTDLVIQGGSKNDMETVGCVSANVSQSVSFELSSHLLFDPGSKLRFTRSIFQCGVETAPDGQSLVSSSTETLITGISGGAWSQEFSFLSVEPSMLVYRLCVLKHDGVWMDFSPLGVRVSDIVVSSTIGVSLGTAHFAPVSTETLTITGSFAFASQNPHASKAVGKRYTADTIPSLATTAYIYFIDSYDPAINCLCAYNATCPTASGAVAASDIQPVQTSPITFDFSGLAGSKRAHLCAQFTLSNGQIRYQPVAYECVSIDFSVMINPSSVPANDGQMIAITSTGSTLQTNDVVFWVVEGATCSNTSSMVANKYSTNATYTSSGGVLSFNFSPALRIGADNEMFLCVSRMIPGGGYHTFPLPSTTLTITQGLSSTLTSVGILGDPHVRASDGTWLDFFGEAGVYSLLESDNMQANAKFGYAVRNQRMLWHPKVMRPGTLIEEIGVRLVDEQVSLRLAVHGGGLVSVRGASDGTQFWTTSDENVWRIGDYVIIWSACQDEATVPWGAHQRMRSLTVEGRGEYLQMFVAQSDGYHFIDVEAMPQLATKGLLADAHAAPEALAARLISGGETNYRVDASAMIQSH